MKRTWTQVAGIHDFVLKESGPGFDEVRVAFALELFGYRSDRVIDIVVAEHQKADGREDSPTDVGGSVGMLIVHHCARGRCDEKAMMTAVLGRIAEGSQTDGESGVIVSLARGVSNRNGPDGAVVTRSLVSSRGADLVESRSPHLHLL